MKVIGISTRQKEFGVTPGSLRGSGATHFYMDTEDVQRIAWRGRWAKLKTLEHYLQEVAAQLLLHKLPEETKQKIRVLSEACDSLIQLELMKPKS